MNEQVAEMKINNLENSVENLTEKIDKIPEEVAKRIDESINLKIENAKQEIKLDFYKWLVPIILGLLFSWGAIIFEFVTKK